MNIKGKLMATSWAVLLILLLGILSCVPTASETPVTKPPVSSPVSTPTQKPASTPTGTLTIVIPNLGEELVVPWLSGGESRKTVQPVYDYLFLVNPATKQLGPGLATDYKMSEDGLTWTFHLRKGIQFQDGWGEFTSADVKFTFESQRGPTSKDARATPWRDTITQVDTPDPYTIVFRLKAPLLSFASDWSNFYSIGIVSKKYIESVGVDKAKDYPIGTGAYKLVSHTPGESFKFEALPTPHWRVGVPQFQYIVIKAVKEEATQVSMLLAGEADVIPVSFDSIPRVEKAGLRVFSLPSAYTNSIAFGGLVNPDNQYYDPKNPFLDQRVRQAVNLAINRDEIIKTLYQGKAVPATFVYLSPGWQDLKPYPYDPVKAKQLLADAGYPSGLSAEIRFTSQKPDTDMMTKAVAMYWEAIGIKTKLVPSDYATIRKDASVGKTAGWSYPVAFLPYYDFHPVPMASMLDPAKPAWLMYSDPNVYNLLRQLTPIVDRDKRNAIFKKVAQVMYDAYAVAPIVVAPETYGLSKRVGTWSPVIAVGGASMWDTITRAP